MGDMSPGRRHYERRVSQARATRKPVMRKSVEQATMLELLAMSEWYEPSEHELMGGLMFEEWMMKPDPVIDIVVSRDGSSQRTVEELLNVFLDDVIAIALDNDVDGIGSRLDEIRDRTDVDDVEHLDWLANQAETLLFELGYLVEWNDGYMIYREV